MRADIARRKILLFPFGILWVLCFLVPANAQNYLVFQSKEFEIAYEKSSRAEAEEIREIYGQVKGDIEQILGWKLLSRPLIILVSDRKTFEKMSGSRFTSAFAVPQKHLIVIRISPLYFKSYMLKEVFKHELCHIFIHDHIPDNLLPRWLDEGICQWVSGTMGELLVDGGQIRINRIDLSRHVIPLSQLTYSFPQEKNLLYLAYAESLRFVMFINSRYGKEKLVRVLYSLEKGEKIDAAFSTALSESFDVVEEKWREQLKRKNLWLAWVSQYMYELLFFIGALLAVAGFIRLMIKKRRYAEEDDFEDDF